MTGQKHIRAAVFRDESGHPSIEQLELSGPAPGEVLVRMVATGVCHTDHKAAGPGATPKPVVLGHEGAGIVEAVGAQVTKLKSGDHVVMTFGSCGSCRSCEAVEPAYCYEGVNYCFTCRPPEARPYLRSALGDVSGWFFTQSSFASYAIGLERSVVRIPLDVPLEIMGPMGCGFQTGAGTVFNDLRLTAAQTFLVFGCGAVGLAAVMAARIAGAVTIAVDKHPHRVALAKELGAEHGLVADGSSMVDVVKTLAPFGVDAALDTTGALPVMRQVIDCLAPRGEAILIAAPWDGSELGLNIRNILPGRRIRGAIEGSSNPDVFIPQLIEYWRQGRFPVDRLIKFYALEDIQQAFVDSEEGRVVKPVLLMN